MMKYDEISILAGEQLLAEGAKCPEICSAEFLKLIWKTGKLLGAGLALCLMQ